MLGSDSSLACCSWVLLTQADTCGNAGSVNLLAWPPALASLWAVRLRAFSSARFQLRALSLDQWHVRAITFTCALARIAESGLERS